METYPPKELTRRLQFYWFEDGLPELYAGLGFLAFALLIWAADYTQEPVNAVARFLESVWVILLIVVGNWLVRRLKWRLTFRRTGYVAYPRPSFRGRLKALAAWLAGALGLVLVGILMLHRGLEIGLPILLTVAFVGLYGALGFSLGWRRAYGYAVLALLAGFLSLALVSAGESRWQPFVFNGGLFMLILGFGQALGGSLALWDYLRRYPEPVEEGET